MSKYLEEMAKLRSYVAAGDFDEDAEGFEIHMKQADRLLAQDLAEKDAAIAKLDGILEGYRAGRRNADPIEPKAPAATPAHFVAQLARLAVVR